jgi:hypothetical protein
VPRIPKILHYCFGLDASFGGKPWSLVHYVCVKSALERVQPKQAFIYYEYEPTGKWWKQTKDLLTPIRIEAPREIFGNPLCHAAHRADVVRLEKLIRHGGIYLDADVLVHESFDDLLDSSVVLGWEGVNGEIGLANAVILAEPGARFLKRWYEEYRWFRSKGRDEYWGEHSVSLPNKLAKAYPTEVTILPHTAFYWPLWTADGLRMIYESRGPEVRADYANHLWESNAWDQYLRNATPGRVRDIESNFHRWARPFVEGMPDNYGLPPYRERLKQTLGSQKRSFHLKTAYFWKRLDRARRLGALGIASKIAERLSFLVAERRHRRRTFSKIYKSGLWGNDIESHSRFFSGVGSRGLAAAIYVERLSALLSQHAVDLGKTITVVDLGCGDFEIGRQLVANVEPMIYIGCDIVPELVAHHRQSTKDSRVEFRELDMVADELPAGDVCLIRQVLQHL